MKIIPTILSGGSGTRLWPISRATNPKQFLDFFGKYSLFQQAVLRVSDKKEFQNPIIICNNEHRFLAAEALQKINVKAESIILEPLGRNTAPAIAIAAFYAIKNSNESIILVMPSDHIIQNKNKFITSVLDAKEAAEAGYLITFGIIPRKVETGYGYIKQGKKLLEFKNIFNVEKFIEKPQRQIVESFLKSGEYSWNSGIFMFKASIYLEELKKFQPEVFDKCCDAYNLAIKDLDFIRLEEKRFKQCKNISVDYAVMEKSTKIAVMPLDVGWSDVGNWQAISEISKQDENNNSLVGDVIALKTNNCYVNSHNKIVAVIGVENLIIISLKDVVLVVNKNNTQDVKELFEILKKEKREECNSHSTVLRPWGSFETIDISDRCKVKKITVKPQSSLSLQMHHYRAEHWVVVKGIAHVTCGEKEFTLDEDQSTYIPIGKKHRLENKGSDNLEIIEIQTGNYLGEDDIVRFSDIYGRLTN